MPKTTAVRGHFDGNSVVLDEPVSLAVGQNVRMVIDSAPSAETPSRPSLVGFAKGTFELRGDFNDPLDELSVYQ